MVVVTHEEDIAAFADRIIRFSDGQIISDEKNLNPTAGSDDPSPGDFTGEGGDDAD